MSETRVFVLKPQPGKGLFTAWHKTSLDAFADSFARLDNFVGRNNAFEVRKAESGPGTFGFGSAPIWGFYLYEAIDTVTAGTLTPVNTQIVHSGAALNLTGTSNIYVGGVSALAVTSPHQAEFLTIQNRCFIAATTLSGGNFPQVAQRFPSLTTQRWGVVAPTGNLLYVPYDNATHAENSTFYELTGITTNGTANITSSGDFFVGPWDGKTLIVNNDPAGQTYKINTISAASAGTIQTNSNGSLANVPFKVHYGNLSWGDIPPQYCYAYYNPTTGHCSNRSPVLTISEKNMQDVNVALSGIQRTGDSVNYTRIILFRTSVTDGGRTLLPLRLDAAHTGTAPIVDGMINNSTAGAVTYHDGQADSELGQIIGNFEAPTLNDPTPQDIQYISYWDGRVWGFRRSEPWRLRYSRFTNASELGVGEESWPPTNFINLPSQNAIGTCTKVIGETMVVGTNKYLYYVDGNNETNYRLRVLSSRGGGVTNWAIDQHPGDTTENTASAIYIGRDRRLWRHFPGGRLEDIGAQIQDKIDACVQSGLGSIRPFIVRVMQADKSRFLALGIWNGSTGYSTYFYDFDTGWWADFGYSDPTILPVASISEPAVDWAGSNSCVSILGRADLNQVIFFTTNQFPPPGAVFVPQMRTHPLDMGSYQTKKVLEKVVVYVKNSLSEPASLALHAIFNDSGSLNALSEVVTSGTPRHSDNDVRTFVLRNQVQWHTMALQLVYDPPSTLFQPSENYRVNRVEIYYKVESTGVTGQAG